MTLTTLDSEKGNRTVPVRQVAADYFNGVFVYAYTITEPIDGAVLSVKALDSLSTIKAN